MTSPILLQARGWRLLTAEIVYRIPDHHSLLQTFIHQMIDLPPEFPELNRFLAWWQRSLAGPIHSVRIASAGLVQPVELRYAADLWRLH